VRFARPALPGTREPRLRRLDAGWPERLDGLAGPIRPARIEALLRRLPAPRNRLHAPEAMRQAEGIVRQELREAGWEVSRRPFRYTDARAHQDYGQTLADYSRPVVYPRLEGANLLAVREGTAGSDAVLVLAHLDTVRDSPGADDNGASVAAMIELARALAPRRFRRAVILAATDMEEIGLFGANALAQELGRERSIVGVINFESMGYTTAEPGTQSLPPGIELLFPHQVRRMRRRDFRGEFTAAIYNGPAARLAALFARALADRAGPHAPLLLRDPRDLPVIGRLLRRAVPAVRHFARGDHLPFWRRGIPGLFVTDTANFRYPHYHTPLDTPEKLDYRRLAAIAAAAAMALAEAAGLEE
jgi:hypothetical protein